MTIVNSTSNNSCFVLSESLNFLTGLAHRALNRRLSQALKENNIELTSEQFTVLFYLWEKDGVCQRELSFKTGKDTPGMTRILDKLEKKDFIERRSNPEDRRHNLIYVTSNAEELKEQSTKIALLTLKEGLEGVDLDELNTCKKVLQQVQSNIEKTNNLCTTNK